MTFNSEGNMKEEDDDEDDSMTGAIIIVLVVAILIVAALVGAVFYMRGRGNKGTTPVNTSVKRDSPQQIPLSSATPNGTDAGANGVSMENDLIGTAKGGPEEKVNTDAFATAGTDGAYKK